MELPLSDVYSTGNAEGELEQAANAGRVRAECLTWTGAICTLQLKPKGTLGALDSHLGQDSFLLRKS